MVNSSYVIKRIKKSEAYHYDEETDRFISDKKNNEDLKLFMNLDELYGPGRCGRYYTG